MDVGDHLLMLMTEVSMLVKSLNLGDQSFSKKIVDVDDTASPIRSIFFI